MTIRSNEDVFGTEANKQANLIESCRQRAILLELFAGALKQLRCIVTAEVDHPMHEPALTIAELPGREPQRKKKRRIDHRSS